MTTTVPTVTLNDGVAMPTLGFGVFRHRPSPFYLAREQL
jgi:hypothetical protein